MKNLKYIALYVIAVFSLFGLYYPIDVFSENSVELQKQLLLKQAQTHFYDQVNTRKWNASYGGIYALAKKGQIPNPYLKNNTLKTDDNQTLIKINPAWMTRQLSEISTIKDFHFRITSLMPINPNNVATSFEKKALEYVERTNEKEYYELGTDSKFNYLGALVTTKECMPCHEQQGYKIGDLRGGISVTLDSSEYESIESSIKRHAIIVKIFVLLFILSIVLLIRKQLKNNEELKIEIQKRTKEIKSTLEMLQQILDSDLSLLLVADGSNIIFTNKTLLDFFELDSVEEFRKRYPHISDTFEVINDNDFLQHLMNGEHWIKYLHREQGHKELKVLIKKDAKKRYFKPHAKEINIDNKQLYLIIFDEITRDFERIMKLEERASTDTLTKLFNRGKFDDILSKEIELCQTTLSPLSLLFIDIDHFKVVNDTLGHNVGDEVLVELANILTSSTRAGDTSSRWGGEEFAITLQSTDASKASIIAEKIRKRVENYTFKSAGKITISIGVTEYKDKENKNDFTNRVDEALYTAKKNGRNMVVVL